MIRDGYVLAVIANGNVLNEDSSNKIGLPFGTEFKVRLINKNYNRCASDLVINGEKVARFILDSNQTSDIERYLDGNLNSGSKFKFTSLHDSAVKDKGSFENGLVEVFFYKEKIKPIFIKEEHYHHHWDSKPYKDPYSPFNPYPRPSAVWGNAIGNNMLFCSASLTGAEGATVRGSKSEQSFSEVSGLEFDSIPTVLKLKLVNGELSTAVRYCTSCGKKRHDSDKFCGNCGTRY